MEDSPRPATATTPAPPGNIIGIGFLFGTIYFIQGIGEPTEGLIAQPVKSLLKSWGHSARQIAAFAALLALPWALKPIYGWFSDFIPLAGSRRKNYLLLTSFITATSLIALYFFPPPAGARNQLLLLLLAPTIGVAFADVVSDALMIETGQPRGLTGKLQSIQWASMYAATILTGWLGGYLSQHGLQTTGFLICGLMAASLVVLTVLFVREPPAPSQPGFHESFKTLIRAIRLPAVQAVALFLFLWNFNPFSSSVLYVHMTDSMGFSEQFHGETVSLLSIGSVAACAAYGFYCRRISMIALVHCSIILGIASTLAYWAQSGGLSARLVALAVGFTYMTATLVQLDLGAQVCPPAVAGTVFAVYMSVSNLSTSVSTWIGGAWYESWKHDWGSQSAFHMLVGIGALFTAACWLITPLIRRHHAVANQS